MAIGRRKGEAQEPVSTVTEEELKSMVDAGHEGGVLEGDERQMIYSIFELGDTLVREIMLPRIYINALDVSDPTPMKQWIQLIKSGHSRVPVYEESVDNIVGFTVCQGPAAGMAGSGISGGRERGPGFAFIRSLAAPGDLRARSQEGGRAAGGDAGRPRAYGDGGG